MNTFEMDSLRNVSAIVQATEGFSGSLAFGYSYANQLTSIATSQNYGTTEVRFVYDGLGRLAQRRNASNQVTASYYYAGNRLTYLVEGNNEVTFQWGAGEPLSQIQGGNTYWYVLDALGNVVGLVNNSNTLVAKYVYDAWGTEASTSFDNLTVKNPLRYRGSQGYLHLYGPDACRGWSLYLAGARVYHTGVGRWLQEDPLLGNLGDPMSFNRYLYTNANPVDYSDPSGLATGEEGPVPTVFLAGSVR